MSEGDDGSLGISVILPERGPTLLFEKVGRRGEKGRRFYACSACRDRKDCSFFQWEDDKVSEARLLAREGENRSKRPGLSQQEYCSRFRKFVSLPVDEKKFCHDCQMLLLPDEHAAHSSHRSTPVTTAQLRRPSVLLSPLDNKKKNAQYLFTDRSAHFLLDALASQGFTKVLCVGTPRLQELIKLRSLEQKHEPMKTLLLDIDFRYAQFYSQDEFCHYNMFNHHFFDGEASSATLQEFLREGDGEKVVMVADPPFGGLVKPLANSFSLIAQTWRKLQSSDCSEAEMPMIWIFPYFFEPRIIECLPSLTMLDYQVDYDNHLLYKHGKTGRKQSPVRLFTNICPRDVVLPQEEGYRDTSRRSTNTALSATFVHPRTAVNGNTAPRVKNRGDTVKPVVAAPSLTTRVELHQETRVVSAVAACSTNTKCVLSKTQTGGAVEANIHPITASSSLKLKGSLGQLAEQRRWQLSLDDLSVQRT
ncbi:hypothetical protein INR49_017182 [Caranx melampygus]|nr:hypothetical protein INR49_017182 [Caranx melampygus]